MGPLYEGGVHVSLNGDSDVQVSYVYVLSF